MKTPKIRFDIPYKIPDFIIQSAHQQKSMNHLSQCAQNERNGQLTRRDIQGLQIKSQQVEQEMQQLKSLNNMLLSDISLMEKDSSAVKSELVLPRRERVFLG